jgi:hypothetical protein
MLGMTIVLLAAALSDGRSEPSARTAVAGSTALSCPAENGQSHRLAVRLANDPAYVNVRARVGIAASSDVAVLTDAADAPRCQQMLAYAQQKAEAAGGSLTGTTTVFYRAGSCYFAIVTAPPPPVQTPPQGYLQIRTGFTLVYVFDGSLQPLGAAAL